LLNLCLLMWSFCVIRVCWTCIKYDLLPMVMWNVWCHYLCNIYMHMFVLLMPLLLTCHYLFYWLACPYCSGIINVQNISKLANKFSKKIHHVKFLFWPNIFNIWLLWLACPYCSRIINVQNISKLANKFSKKIHHVKFLFLA
jgi:hypothetical protein